jgi:RNA polymerase sigma-70 factor (ECF subfamily)
VTGTEPDADVDLVLVRLAQAGDTEAFGRLVERNRHAVHRAAYAALGSSADADDAAQEAFVTAYKKLAGFRGESSFRTWLLSIAWRKALDRRRGLAKWIRLTASPDPFSDGASGPLERVPSPEPSAEDRLAGDEVNRQLKRLIATLPRKLRDALILAVPGEFTYDEIGRMLEIPVGTVKWRVSEARRILKDKLIALGYTHER